MTHICVGKPTIIGSDNGLSPGRRQAIIRTNAGILLIGPLGANFSEMLSEIQTFSLNKMRLKMSSAECCPFHFGLNMLSKPGICHNSVHNWSEYHGILWQDYLVFYGNLFSLYISPFSMTPWKVHLQNSIQLSVSHYCTVLPCCTKMINL